MKESILVHYHPDERAFVERMMDVTERIAERHEMRKTDFLDPRQLSIVQSLVNRHDDLHMIAEGGHPDAERKRAVIAHDYMALAPDDCALKIVSITSTDERIGELDHGDYLGALLGLGIKRDKIGDLHVRPDGCHVIVAAEMADYIDTHLRQVHRLHVLTELLAPDRLIPVLPQLEEMSLTVASMRLDGIVGDVWRLSRAKALVPIRAGRCKVNWKAVEDPSCLLKEGDTVSLRGFGRFVLRSVEGETKKGRIRIAVAKYV